MISLKIERELRVMKLDVKEEVLHNFKHEGSVNKLILVERLVFTVNSCEIAFKGSLEMVLFMRH